MEFTRTVDMGAPGSFPPASGRVVTDAAPPEKPPFPGDPLEDRIRFGIEESVDTRTGMALQLAKTLAAWNAKGLYHQQLSALHVLVSAGNAISLAGPQSSDASRLPQNVHEFGWILHQLLSAQLDDTPHDNRQPDLDSLYMAGISPALVKIVDSCTDSTTRVASFTKIVRALEAAQQSSMNPTRPADHTQLAILILGCMAGLSAIIWFLVH